VPVVALGQLGRLYVPRRAGYHSDPERLLRGRRNEGGRGCSWRAGLRGWAGAMRAGSLLMELSRAWAENLHES
jgi:hypothetical protein